MIPVILIQRYIADESNPKYRDVEGVIYHYPRVYFKRVLPDDRFVYYRPAKNSSSPDGGTYFGFGRLGVPYADPVDAALRFVDIRAFQRFHIRCPCARRMGGDRNGRVATIPSGRARDFDVRLSPAPDRRRRYA